MLVHTPIRRLAVSTYQCNEALGLRWVSAAGAVLIAVVDAFTLRGVAPGLIAASIAPQPEST
jgi:hypothetical protein